MCVYALLRSAAKVYVLEEPSTSIGRDESCDLRLGGRGVSRLHAELAFVGPNQKEPTLTDLGSSNGTFVNGERLRAREPQFLHHGDHLHFSAYEKTSFRFELPDKQALGDDVRRAPAGRTPSKLGDGAISVPKETRQASGPPKVSQRELSEDRNRRDGARPAVASDRHETVVQEAKPPWRPRSTSGEPVKSEGGDPSPGAATLAAMEKAVGHIQGLFERLQEANAKLSPARSQRGASPTASPGKESVQPARSASVRAERLAALVQKAERLAAIHVPKEMLRLQQATSSGGDRKPTDSFEAAQTNVDDTTKIMNDRPRRAVDKPQRSSDIEAYAVLRTSSTVYVLEEQLTSIGRDEACDMRLRGRGVSRFQAEIVFQNGLDGKLRDLGSSNGTYVNGERLRDREERTLAHGDILHFSAYEKTSFRFELPGYEDLGVLVQDATFSPPPAKASVSSDVISKPEHGVPSSEQVDTTAKAALDLMDTQIPWRQRIPSSHTGDCEAEGVERIPRGSDTPEFGPSVLEECTSTDRKVDGLQAELSNIGRAVERLEDMFSRMQSVGELPHEPQPLQAAGDACLAANLANPLAERLQTLVERAERLASIEIPNEKVGLDQGEVPLGRAQMVNDTAQERIECHAAPHASKPSKRDLEPRLQALSLPLERNAQDVVSQMSQLQRDLAVYEGLVPADAGNVTVRKNESESMIATDLLHWQQAVSGKDMLSRDESSAVLGVLLRAERALAELRRSEKAANRRWTSMTEEGQLLKDRLRALHDGVRKLRDRGTSVSKAAAEQRRKLWAQLEDDVASSGTSEERLAALRVREELERLGNSIGELQSRIGELDDEAEQHASKEIEAQCRRTFLESLSRKRPELEGAEKSSAAMQESLDEIVELELENERLQWELYYAEKNSLADTKANGLSKDSEQAPEPVLWKPLPSASHSSRSNASFIEVSEVPMLEGSIPGSIPARRNEENRTVGSVDESLVGTLRPQEFSDNMGKDPACVVRSSSAVPRDRPADLCRRLSLSRDERREMERGPGSTGSRGRSSSRNRGRPPVARERQSAFGDEKILKDSACLSKGHSDDLTGHEYAESLRSICSDRSDRSRNSLNVKSQDIVHKSNFRLRGSADTSPGRGDLTCGPKQQEETFTPDDQGPSQFWNDAQGDEDDVLGLTSHGSSNFLRNSFVPNHYLKGGRSYDSLDLLCERSTASTMEPVGQLPQQGVAMNRRPPSMERRPGTGTAAFAGSLAVGGFARQAPPVSAYPPSKSTFESWPAGPRHPSLPVPSRPQMAPWPHVGSSPSASWVENSPTIASASSNLLGFGDEVIDRARPPLSSFMQGPAVRSNDGDFGHDDATFITQSLNLAPTSLDVESRSIFKQSARQPVYPGTSASVARTVKLNLDED